MFEERFERWKTKYPYEYGIDETTANLFYTSTEDLRLSELPTGPVVVIADVTLQPFPVNLLYVEGEFAGRTRPMAAAPSLAWLQAARNKGMIGDGRICAWISTAVSEAESQTLAMVAQRLEPAFKQHEIIFETSPNLPATFAGASMVIIAAHGGVHPEGRYFQVVSDEGILRVTAGDLANVLRNVGIVVLFVCSGGRADKHPIANTTLGLAKQILDRGCAAVIASPWPLDARVPSHWLPEFLMRWFQGESLIEANFAANQIVDQRFSQDPARGLAMTIFGNPGLRKT
jgi:CHAT domain-containing protein